MSNYEDRRRGVSREDRIGDREAADWRDRREEQARTADLGQTPRNIAEYEDRVRGGYPRVSGDDRTGHGGAVRDYGRTDYAGGMREDMSRYGDRDAGFPERPRGPSTYQEDRFSDRGLGYRSFSGSLGGGAPQEYGYGERGRGQERGYGRDYGRGHEDDDDPRSYRSGRPGQDRDERGFFSRAGDEIASWFGSDAAERRRERDAREGESTARHHIGRGPRNYRRSDSRIEEDINDRLTRDPYVDASDIEVSVKDGEVTLAGHVDSRSDKRRAEDLAEDVSGVRNVQNNLRVRGREGTGSGYGASGYGSSTATNETTGSSSGTGMTGSTTTSGTSATGSGTGTGNIGTTGSSSASGATFGGSFGESRNE